VGLGVQNGGTLSAEEAYEMSLDPLANEEEEEEEAIEQAGEEEGMIAKES